MIPRNAVVCRPCAAAWRPSANHAASREMNGVVVELRLATRLVKRGLATLLQGVLSPRPCLDAHPTFASSDARAGWNAPAPRHFTVVLAANFPMKIREFPRLSFRNRRTIGFRTADFRPRRIFLHAHGVRTCRPNVAPSNPHKTHDFLPFGYGSSDLCEDLPARLSLRTREHARPAFRSNDLRLFTNAFPRLRDDHPVKERDQQIMPVRK